MVAASAAQVVAGERDKGKRGERITSEVPTCVYKKESVVWLFAFFSSKNVWRASFCFDIVWAHDRIKESVSCTEGRVCGREVTEPMVTC
jgi:hypothetical protein